MILEPFNFKVRDTETGLFLEGGLGHPTWSKNGKVWKTLGQLRCAFTHARSEARYSKKASPVEQIPSNWEIVVYEVLELGTASCSEVIDSSVSQQYLVDAMSGTTLSSNDFRSSERMKTPSSSKSKRSSTSSTKA